MNNVHNISASVQLVANNVHGKIQALRENRECICASWELAMLIWHQLWVE